MQYGTDRFGGNGEVFVDYYVIEFHPVADFVAGHAHPPFDFLAAVAGPPDEPSAERGDVGGQHEDADDIGW